LQDVCDVTLLPQADFTTHRDVGVATIPTNEEQVVAERTLTTLAGR